MDYFFFSIFLVLTISTIKIPHPFLFFLFDYKHFYFELQFMLVFTRCTWNQHELETYWNMIQENSVPIWDQHNRKYFVNICINQHSSFCANYALTLSFSKKNERKKECCLFHWCYQNIHSNVLEINSTNIVRSSK